MLQAVASLMIAILMTRGVIYAPEALFLVVCDPRMNELWVT